MYRPVDRAALQDREDVLVYTGQPARQELVVAGSPRAELWVSADTPDADWVVKVTIVAPDGTARAVSEGILRSSFRDSETNPSPIEPGKILSHTKIDLGHTAFVLAPGHSLRVEVAASCFPMYGRNPNTGEGPFATTERKAKTERLPRCANCLTDRPAGARSVIFGTNRTSSWTTPRRPRCKSL